MAAAPAATETRRAAMPVAPKWEDENAPELKVVAVPFALADAEELELETLETAGLVCELEGDGETRELEVELALMLEVPVTETVAEAEREVALAEVLETVLEVLELTTAPTEKSGDVEKTLLMSPISTACKVYPSPTGIMGRVSVIESAVGLTLLAMAKALLKATLMSSRENVAGSLAADVHLIVTVPPEVGFSGTWRVRAETRGATRTRRVSLENILQGKVVKEKSS